MAGIFKRCIINPIAALTSAARTTSGMLALLGGGAAITLQLVPYGWALDGWTAPLVLLVPWILLLVARRASADPATPLWVLPTLCAIGISPGWAVSHWFLHATTAAGYPFLWFYLPLYWWLFVIVAARWMRLERDAQATGGVLAGRLARVPLAIVLPMVWCAFEFLRGELVLGGYSLYLLGHPLVAPLSHVSDLVNPIGAVGGYGVSALAVLPAAMLADVLWARERSATAARASATRKISIAATLVVAAVVVGLGVYSAAPPATNRTERLRVGVLQTNLAQDNKLDWPVTERVDALNRWLDATDKLAANAVPPDVIAWPETMFPGGELNSEAVEQYRKHGIFLTEPPVAGGDGKPRKVMIANFASTLLSAQAKHGVPMFVGATTTEGLDFSPKDDGTAGSSGRVKMARGARYNSVFLLDKGAVQPARYDKISLTTFGEYIPVVWRFPDVQNFLVSLGARGLKFDLKFGTNRTPFTIRTTPARIKTPICFEMTFAKHFADLVFVDGVRATDVIINPSNDGWFYDSDMGREAHVMHSRMRALETRTPIVRAVNTGVSCAIDCRGMISQRIEARAEGSGIIEVPLDAPAGATVYVLFGWLVPWGCMGVALVLLWAAGRNRH